MKKSVKESVKEAVEKTVRSVVTVAMLCLGLVLTGTGVVHGKGPVPDTVYQTVAPSQLPAQGQDVLKKIYAGGSFGYDKDGTVFGNRERLLPAKDRGFYREYTVKTPGERSRGARRIVCGGLMPTAPDACYYTDDHYGSFRKIGP